LARIESWRSESSSAPIDHEGQRLAATFSAGLALYPEDARTFEDLLRRADIALYRAKAAGRNCSIRWQAGMG
jgi:diguanylate cyclase (GGDEF)-like protein